MKITILATLLVFLAYFLLLYGAVGFIQDKRFFASAPQENLAAIPDRKERFRGAHALGMDAVGVLYGYGSRAELAAAGAYKIAESVADLRHLLLD